MGRTLQLYQLQSLDSQIDQANKELADIAAKLGESNALKKARSETEAAEEQLRKAQTVVQDLDLEVKGLANKIATEEKKLYSGKVLNAKEAANLQDEVASLRRRHGEREERLLEAMLEAEEAEALVNQKQTELARVEAEWKADQEELKHKQKSLNSTLAELQERRPSMTGGINADDLAQYEKLRAKKAGRGIVAVKNGVCQGCGMTLSNNRVQKARAGAQLVYCSTCGRILYVP